MDMLNVLSNIVSAITGVKEVLENKKNDSENDDKDKD